MDSSRSVNAAAIEKRIEDTTNTVPVPLHDPVKRGMLSSIIRQSELPRALFEHGE